MKPGTGSQKRESTEAFRKRLVKEMRKEARRLERDAQRLKDAVAAMDEKK